MTFSRRTAQLLHEDHQATIAMIESLEQMIMRARRSQPDVNDPHIRRVLEAAGASIEHEIQSHFAFEENELFTRLAEAGDVGIGEHLKSEHQAMRGLAGQVALAAKEALSNGFTDDSWRTFASLAGELIERMLAHIQKEEMALLPMLDELLDPETDMRLAGLYADNQ